MNVLSLFDGISCGQLAFSRVGITISNYYASEIDKHAIQVTTKNFPNTIQLGDVTQVDGHTLPTIDILIGGSPCQGFSICGKQLAFDDPRSKLFFEYVRILKEVKPKFFLLENVKMKKEYQDIISEYLGVPPIEINSSLVSAQNRKRLYWTNIPDISQPVDRGILLKDILQTNVDKKYYLSDIAVKWIERRDIKTLTGEDKSFTLTTSIAKRSSQDPFIQTPCRIGIIGKGGQGGRVYDIGAKSTTLTAHGGGWGAKTGLYYDLGVRRLTPVECERLQTISDDYTSGVSDSQRYRMLGNAWTVDVIVHILSNLQNN